MSSSAASFLDPPDPPKRPDLAPPRGACDCHAHVIGPLDVFPLAQGRIYSAANLPVDAYLRMLDRIGFDRGVVVTASAYGTDNRATMHALQQAGGRLRGVVVIDETTSRAEMNALAGAGVGGARFAEVPGYTGTVGFETLEILAPAMRELGWHAQIWTSGPTFLENAARLTSHGVALVVDHMGRFDPARGTDHQVFRGLLRLLGDGKIWIKLPAYRLSDRFPDYENIRPFHEAFVRTNPDHLVWGTDWPHVNMTADMPDVGHLVDLFQAWTASEATRRKILADNPARLYGFPP